MAWLDALTLSTVIVHTQYGMSFKGLKQAVYDDCIVLRDAMVLDEGADLLDGQVIVPREAVAFMQILEGPS